LRRYWDLMRASGPEQERWGLLSLPPEDITSTMTKELSGKDWKGLAQQGGSRRYDQSGPPEGNRCRQSGEYPGTLAWDINWKRILLTKCFGGRVLLMLIT